MQQKKEEMAYAMNSRVVWGFIIRRWKQLAVITLLSGIVSAGVSFLIPNRYRSVVIFYPTVTQSVSNLLDLNLAVRKDFGAYGEEEEAERAIQMLSSSEVREFIIGWYDLWNHYGIEKDRPGARTKMYKKFNKNVSFRRTEFNSVEISVLDTKPEIAAGMANDIAGRLDTIKNRIQRERASEGLKVVEETYSALQVRVKEVSDSLDVIRGLGINDYERQSEKFNEQYAVAISRGDVRAIKQLEEKLSILSMYGGAYMNLASALELLNEQMVLLEQRRNMIAKDANNDISQKMVVDYAYPADQKTYPKRTLLVLGCMFFTFVLSLFFFVGLEQFRQYQNANKEG
jgi:uncharacterized protein involved in exopolysaccharide biosynthesis